ncbi:response regulator transcription factor [Phytoactinopolyspora limicola]|uniref:response regulator transcription factor n=1 Tax=Phytoactinopolyspora limicola TaxID=2715536 RepID=UPI001FE87091|nr:LuxR C-terminal-related transcriptional regulator [Phytoactinopolyspora limicola]
MKRERLDFDELQAVAFVGNEVSREQQGKLLNSTGEVALIEADKIFLLQLREVLEHRGVAVLVVGLNESWSDGASVADRMANRESPEIPATAIRNAELMGGDVPPGMSAGAAAEGWDGLTEAEWPVAVLVAEGLTNRQVAEKLFLSSHTVDSHLRHVFTKLGINSRTELARKFTERRLA